MRRWEWLTELALQNEWRHGAELGVKRGRTLFYLLDHCPQLHMIGVDIWAVQEGRGRWGYAHFDHEAFEAEARLRAEDYPGRVTLLKMKTTEAACVIQDASLDFVFVDADHNTDAVEQDITAWLPKLKSSGLMCGHDGNKDSVKAALNAVLKKDWNLVGHDGCWKKGSP